MVAVVDLFAGAGGFGIAAQRVGCDLRLSIELSKVACSTLEHNAEPGHRVLEGDVIDVEGSALRKLAGLGAKERLIVVGGAPCQPFLIYLISSNLEFTFLLNSLACALANYHGSLSGQYLHDLLIRYLSE